MGLGINNIKTKINNNLDEAEKNIEEIFNNINKQHKQVIGDLNKSTNSLVNNVSLKIMFFLVLLFWIICLILIII